MRSATLLLFSLLSCAVFADPDHPPTDEEFRAVERAHLAAGEVRQNFKKALDKAIRDKGIRKSIGDCKVTASDIESLRVGRTSHKLRNPGNAAPEWVKPYLDKYSAMSPKRIPKSATVPLGKGHVGYVEPIFIEPICLNCHGQNLTSGVVEDLQKYYPNDTATGFKVGDFRGLLWVEWKAPEGKTESKTEKK